MPRRAVTGRRMLACAVLGIWVLVLAQHIRREYLKPAGVRLAEGALALAPGSHFYTIQLDGRAIGLASSRLDTVPTGFQIDDLVMLDVPALGRTQSATIRTWLDLGRSLELRAFRFELESDIGPFSASGEVRGDTLLELELRAGGSAERSRVPWSRDQVLAAALPLRLAAGGELSPGREHIVRVFDPSVMDSRELRIRVAERDTLIVVDTAGYQPDLGQWVPLAYDTVPVWRLEETFGSVRSESWIDDDGRLVRARSPLGFTMERQAFEIARAAWRAARDAGVSETGYGAIIESTAIAANMELPGGAGPDSLAVRLLGTELTGFDLHGGRQVLRGDTLFIARERVSDAGYRLPYAGGGEPAAELGASPLIQVDDPRIIAAAREAAAGSDDPVEVARRLNDWVHAALRKELVVSVPSAVQVLEAGAGDCNEHTVLYVALARALGLPARTAVGLVHLDGRFYYHAWPEVWLGEWVAVEPTLGQFPADAAHLRFLVGGLARQVELLGLIGRLRLEIL